MTRSFAGPAVSLLVLGLAACTGSAPPVAAPAAAPADSASVLAAQRAWWRAFAIADTAYLRAHTSPVLSLTVSSGRTFDRERMLAEAATHTAGGRLAMEWAEETVRRLGPGTALATTRATETDGPASSVYRYLTVLERTAEGWRVSAGQSTRELVFTPRLSAAQAGPLDEYAGGYRTPRGAALRVEVRDSSLALIEPSGTEIPLEPIAPDLFEFRVLSPSNGVVRMMFTRDASGRVAAMSRLLSGAVNTFPRIP